MRVLYKNDLPSDSDIQRHKNKFVSLIPWILPISLHLSPVLFYHHAHAAASDITDVYS